MKPKNFSQALDELDELRTRIHDEAVKSKDKIEEQVKENPWATVGIVGLIFFVLGFLLAGVSRRRD